MQYECNIMFLSGKMNARHKQTNSTREGTASITNLIPLEPHSIF